VEGNPHGKNQVLVPAELPESFQPIIGQSVIVRPLRPEDADIEAAFLTGLSPESRYNRLLGGMIKITREYVEKLTTVDFSRDMAFAAVLMLEHREVLIGVARYVLDADGKDCEFAIVIADTWQGLGIGGRLMKKLLAVARSRGLRQMHGEVLSTNVGMLEFCRRLGFTLGRNPDDATVTRATLSLRLEGRQGPSPV